MKTRLSVPVLILQAFFLTLVSALGPAIFLYVPVPANTASLRPLERNLVSLSIQARDFTTFAKTDLLKNFLGALSVNIRTHHTLRLGGAESDKTIYNPAGTITPEQYMNGNYGGSPQNVTIGPNYFAAIKGHYASSTKLIWTLNLRNVVNNWEAGISTAQGVLKYLGSQLEYFEIGNEADAYGLKGWRDQTWNVAEMALQWKWIAEQVQQFNQSVNFGAGAFANIPPNVIGNFDIPGVINAGIKGPNIPWYNMHLYPQSGCANAAVNLETLLRHDVLDNTLSGYIPQVAAAENAGAKFAMGETNSVSCSGRAGVSDTLASALWLVDYALLGASLGIRRAFFHTTPNGAYSAVIPKPYKQKTATYSGGFLPLAYGAYFVSEILSSENTLHVQPIQYGSDTDHSSYAIWDDKNNLKKLVFINLEMYNSSTGASNPAMPDSPVYPSTAARGSTRVFVATPWGLGEKLSLIRLQGPGSNAKSMVNVSDFTFSTEDGTVQSNVVDTILTVQADGFVIFDVNASEAVLIQHYSDVVANPHPTKSLSTPATTVVDGVTMITRGATSPPATSAGAGAPLISAIISIGLK
ncbi:hypothetical protein TWF694_007159 [Orbilia ellipsospora]|uniref:Beta-glucuronidase C-terminal domain-containing protein n=1 Tax=Orbilia ellipsospora TaxID=2528407 RepID=A0AAV9XGY5_9PEZI